MADQYKETKSRLEVAESKIKELSKDEENLLVLTANLQSENRPLQLTCNDLEQYIRREYVKIKGVAYNSDENTDDQVITLAKDMRITLNKNDISVSHRINYQSQEFEDQSEQPKKWPSQNHCEIY